MFLIYRLAANGNDGDCWGKIDFGNFITITKLTKFRILRVAPALGHIVRIHPNSFLSSIERYERKLSLTHKLS